MALSNAQLQIAVASLARSMTLPSPNGNQTGLFIDSGNNLVVPIAGNQNGIYNSQLGANLRISLSADGNNILIGQNIGDASGGL